MVLSPQLLAKMSVTPSYSNGVTSWSINMNFKYPFAWKTVSSFVLRQKAKGPPDDMVTLEVERNTFKYVVKMPWYARLVLAKSIVWHDVISVNKDEQVLSEDGTNVSLRRLGSVRDMSIWRACKKDPDVTLYEKKIDFDIRMPVGPTIMMQVAQPLVRWFQTKSHLCRELEVEAIRDYLAEETLGGEQAEEADQERPLFLEEQGQNGRRHGRPSRGRGRALSSSSSGTEEDGGDSPVAITRMASVKSNVRAKAKAAAAAGTAVAKQSQGTVTGCRCEGDE